MLTIVEKAGLDPAGAPTTWDELIANAKTVMDRGAAPFGVVLRLPRLALTDPDHALHQHRCLRAGNRSLHVEQRCCGAGAGDHEADDGAGEPRRAERRHHRRGVDRTPDDDGLPAAAVRYYIKYQNAPMRFAATWPDPTKLRWRPCRCRKAARAARSSGIPARCCSRTARTSNRRRTTMTALTTDQRIWQESVAGNPEKASRPWASCRSATRSGKSTGPAPPEWLTGQSVGQRRSGISLPNASAIAPTQARHHPVQRGRPFYSAYLSGERTDAKTALTEAYDAVKAEVRQGHNTSRSPSDPSGSQAVSAWLPSAGTCRRHQMADAVTGHLLL